MYRRMVLLTFALLLSHARAVAKCNLQATESLLQNKDPQVLKEVEQLWLQAYGEENTAVLDCILADDFQIGSMPDEKAEVHDKKHVLDWVSQRSRTVQKIEQFELEPHGNLGVVRGIYSMSGQDGKVLARYQFVDVFVYRRERWQALTREIAELLLKSETVSFNDAFVTAGGLRLHVVSAGKGPLILFLHGFPEFWYEWKNQLQEFSKDRLAVAPDLPGYNLSDKPADLAQYRADVLVEDIRQLADHFRHDQKFILVGHDWGGALAWAFAVAHPDYLQKLVIINAPHPAIFGRLLASNPDQQKASQYMLMFRSPQAEATLSANNYALLVQRILREGGFPEEDTPVYLKA